MKKYVTIVKTEFQRILTYRINHLTWRLGDVVQILIQVLIWTIIFDKMPIVQGYNYQEMMTYVIIGMAFTVFTYNFGLELAIAKDIQRGELSNFVVKPISYIKYLVLISFGRITIALSGSVIISMALVLIFRENLILNTSLAVWALIVAMLVLAYFIQLFLTVLVGFIAFWTVDTSGIFYSMQVVSRFLSGTYFPINLLPLSFVNFCFALPFVYTFFFPIQIYLGKISLWRGMGGLALEAAWLLVLFFAVKLVWRMGLKKYESLGI